MAASKGACGALRGFSRTRCFSLFCDYNNRYMMHSRQFASVIQHAIDKMGPVEIDDDEFRVLVIPGHTLAPERKRFERRKQKETPPPRYKNMSTEQDWTSVWPTAESFKWSVVPFPVRQGYARRLENQGIPPGKYANAELMKIPNFLHLTPAHIKQHCAAMKKYCTTWPAGLDTDDQCERHFPLTVISRSYLVDSPTIRDPRARIVTFQVKLASLSLDYHARDKLLRLVGDRYNPDTDVLTLTTDTCPLRKQNYEYANYLLTALCLESRKTEPWESEKTVADMELYVWDLMASKKSLLDTVQHMRQTLKAGDVESTKIPKYVSALSETPVEDEVVDLPLVAVYRNAVTELHNEGEDLTRVSQYKEAVKRLLLNVPTPVM